MNRTRNFQIAGRFFLVFLVFGLAGRFGVKTYGQAQPLRPVDQRYTFVFIHVPLATALNELIDETDIEIFYASDLIAGKTVYCNIENATAREALSCILAEANLDFYQQSSGLYVIIEPQEESPRYGSITGIVLDAMTNEPLPHASVLLTEASAGVASNLEGRFAFGRLKPGAYRLYASHVAYEARADSIFITPAAHRQIEIRLTQRIVMTTPIVINGLYQELPSEAMNAYKISAGELQDAPAFSTPSILQSLDVVVGVHVGDALADVHVQGGDSGEHQYLLDDAPVFVPIRNGGFFGSFSPFAISQVTVHKAGFEARHGSYLSGSIEMDHDLASHDGSNVTLQADPLSLNGRLNGVLKGKKNRSAQWMVAGRVGLWEIFQPGQLERSFREWSRPNVFLTSTLAGDANTMGSPPVNYADSLLNVAFSDLHAATRIRFDATKSVYASMYSGKNEFGIGTAPHNLASLPPDQFEQPADAYRWTNRMSQVRYEWVQGNRTFITVGIWASNYRLAHPFAESPFLSLQNPDAPANPELTDDFNEIKELALSAGFDWAPGARHVVSGKLEAVNTETEFKLSIDPFADSLAITDRSISPIKWRIQSFLEDAVSLSERTRLTIGSRFTYLPLQERLYAEPRLSIRHDLVRERSGTWAMQFAAGLYRQFYNQFDVASYISTALLPSFRFWIPVNKDIRASSAYHTSAGLLFIPSERWQFNLEGYYKYNPYLTALDYSARLDAEPIDNTPGRFWHRARGYSYGAGLSMAYRLPHLHLKTTYEYAISRRKLHNRFENRFVSVPWETPHTIFAELDYTPRNRLTVTLRWQGLIGRSWGYRRAYYDYLEPDSSLPGISAFGLSTPERHRLPAYTQWDLGVAYSRRLGRLGLQGRFNVINLLDESNVIDWVLLRDDHGDVSRVSRKTTSFFPSASIKLTY